MCAYQWGGVGVGEKYYFFWKFCVPTKWLISKDTKNFENIQSNNQVF